MGCGASKQEPAVAEQEPQGPPPLTQDEKNAIAVEGLKDAMTWALDQSIITLSSEAIWISNDDVKITVPVQDKIDTAKEKVGSIPFVGGKLAEGLVKSTEPFEVSFANAGMVVASHERTRTTFTNVITSIDVSDAISLTRAGGVSACVEYVKEKGSEVLKTNMVEVVEEVMKEHKLTSVWNTFIEAYNGAANKIPGNVVEPIKFDLNEYVLESSLRGIFTVMMDKEKEIRAAPGKAVSLAARQAFGSADPSTWKKQ